MLARQRASKPWLGIRLRNYGVKIGSPQPSHFRSGAAPIPQRRFPCGFAFVQTIICVHWHYSWFSLHSSDNFP
jgi:hypothetical protein